MGVGETGVGEMRVIRNFKLCLYVHEKSFAIFVPDQTLWFESWLKFTWNTDFPSVKAHWIAT